MTQVDLAKKGKISQEVKTAARDEGVDAKSIVKGLADGTIVLLKNSSRKNDPSFKPQGVGKGLRTKVNANIGTSPDRIDLKSELKKLEVSISAGADAVMDLSTGGNLKKIREAIVANSTIPIGTVPIYQAVCQVVSRRRSIEQLETEALFSVIEEHAALGVDFLTVHCGITKKTVESLKKNKRFCGVVSRGGTFLTQWIIKNNKENPLYEHYDRLLDIAYKYDVTLSLGDGFRPGSIIDACDKPQLAELKVLGELVLEARRRNVQVMVEGPGHMPINMIVEHVKDQKRVTKGAPFYVLGPLTTDVAAGYDHITSAIGGALAAASGADFLCYVTPAEHLHLPDIEDVRQGVIASRIAAHSGDLAKNVAGAREWDKEFSRLRKDFDWGGQEKLSIDPEKFAFERARSKAKDSNSCTMCGQFCAMKEMNKLFEKE